MNRKSICILITVTLFVLVGCAEVSPSPEEEYQKKEPAGIIGLVKQDLAEHLNTLPANIELVSTEEVEWNDASLGVPGRIAAQVITPGYIVTLKHNDTEYVYHTDTRHSFVRIEETEEQATQEPSAEEATQEPATEETVQESKIPVIQATVTRVVDGDTIHADLNGVTEKIRIIGVDTPETVHPDKPVEPFGPEASAFAKEKLDDRQIWLELDVSERCRFGRLLAYVWIEQPVSGSESEVRNKMFNAMLLLSGYAQVSTFPPNVKYVDMFTQFQREAREANKGIWKEEQPSENVHEAPQTGDIVIQNVDLFEEFATIKNVSDSNIDMAGWRLISTEGNQIFSFPDGFILNASSVVKIDSGPGAAGDGVNSLRWTGSHIWNNDGDPAELYDAQNNKVAVYQ